MNTRAVYDKSYSGYRIFIGDLGNRVGKYDLEKEFDYFGPMSDLWIASNQNMAFVVYKYPEDAEKAVKEMDSRVICGRRLRVEHARPYEPRSSRGPPRERYRDYGRAAGGGGYDKYRNRSYSRSRSRSPRRRIRSRSRERRHGSRSLSRSPVPRRSSGGGRSGRRDVSRSPARKGSPPRRERSPDMLHHPSANGDVPGPENSSPLRD